MVCVVAGVDLLVCKWPGPGGVTMETLQSVSALPELCPSLFCVSAVTITHPPRLSCCCGCSERRECDAAGAAQTGVTPFPGTLSASCKRHIFHLGPLLLSVLASACLRPFPALLVLNQHHESGALSGCSLISPLADPSV